MHGNSSYYQKFHGKNAIFLLDRMIWNLWLFLDYNVPIGNRKDRICLPLHGLKPSSQHAAISAMLRVEHLFWFGFLIKVKVYLGLLCQNSKSNVFFWKPMKDRTKEEEAFIVANCLTSNKRPFCHSGKGQDSHIISSYNVS